MFNLIHTCSISRNTPVGTNGRTQLELATASIACLALPMSARAAVQNQYDVGRAYDFYFDLAADVRVQDQLGYGGKVFTVGGVQRFDVPIAGHLHVMAQQEIGS